MQILKRVIFLLFLRIDFFFFKDLSKLCLMGDHALCLTIGVMENCEQAIYNAGFLVYFTF